MDDRIMALRKLVETGIMTADIAGPAVMKIQEEKLMENNIIAPKITEHVRKGKVQYTCMIPARMSRDGKRHQISASTEAECLKKWTAEMYDVIENGMRQTPVTISDLMVEWMERKRDVKKQTLAGYHSHYENHIKNAPFAKLKIKKIRLQDCKDIIAYLVNYREEKENGTVGLSYNTIRHIRSELSMAFDYAVANEYITVNYMTTVKINQGLCDTTRTRESKAWTDEELRILHDTAIREWEENKKYRYSAVLMAMVFCGCRAGEFCALTWSDFDARRGTLSINKTLTSYRDYEKKVHVQAMSTPKTADSVRKIKLTDAAIFWLKEIKRRQVECGILTKYVVSSRSGKIANQRDLNVRFQIFCKAAGVEYNPTHACRRSYTSVLLDGGVPVTEVSRDLGHKKVTTTLDSYYKPRTLTSATSQKSNVFSATVSRHGMAAGVTAVTAAGWTLQTRIN